MSESESPNMDEIYSQWIELEALALAAEYCLAFGITDPIEVRYVHYYALWVVLEGAR
jgi:hypothetical protein